MWKAHQRMQQVSAIIWILFHLNSSPNKNFVANWRDLCEMCFLLLAQRNESLGPAGLDAKLSLAYKAAPKTQRTGINSQQWNSSPCWEEVEYSEKEFFVSQRRRDVLSTNFIGCQTPDVFHSIRACSSLLLCRNDLCLHSCYWLQASSCEVCHNGDKGYEMNIYSHTILRDIKLCCLTQFLVSRWLCRSVCFLSSIHCWILQCEKP
jgi:hypothetical protein